jgi:ABC-type branched-subunit amino acid transport system ATPase component
VSPLSAPVHGLLPSEAAAEVVTTAEAETQPAPVLRGDQIALVLEHARSGYGPVEVLHGLSLAVPRGQITTVLGPNGAGKSTMCQTVAGLIRVTSGTVRFGDDDLTGLRSHERARAGVVLAPEARGIFPGLTVRENLQMWLPDQADREDAYSRFPILGERRNLLAGSLSGGEQQILTLAPLLVRPPSVLVADEPSLGLAPLIVEQIMRIFVELKERGSAILLVEEKARDVLAIADTVAFLSLGRITWAGPRHEVDDQRLAEAYLGAAH